MWEVVIRLMLLQVFPLVFPCYRMDNNQGCQWILQTMLSLEGMRFHFMYGFRALPLSLTILNYYAERVNNFKHSEHSIVLAIVLITKCSLKHLMGQNHGNKNDHRRIKRKKNTEKLWKLSKVIDREVEMCQNLLLQQFGDSCKSVQKLQKPQPMIPKKKNLTDNRTIKTCTPREANKPFSG